MGRRLREGGDDDDDDVVMTGDDDDDDGREEDYYPIDDTLSLLVFFSPKPTLYFHCTLPDTTYHQLNGRLRVERGVWDDATDEDKVLNYYNSCVEVVSISCRECAK